MSKNGNAATKSFSLPQYLIDELAEAKRRDPTVSESQYVKEGLELRLKKEKNDFVEQITTIMVVIVAGCSISIFSILSGDNILIFVSMGITLLFIGYAGLFKLVKKWRLKKWILQ